MDLYLTLAFTLLCSVLAYVLITRTKKFTKQAASTKILPLKLKGTRTPASFQIVHVYASSQIQKDSSEKELSEKEIDEKEIKKSELVSISDKITDLFTTTTFRHVLGIHQLFSTDRNSTFHINVVFSIRTPCFYLYKKSVPFSHAGKNFAKPFLLNKSKYFVYGNITDQLHDFACKFDFEHFYSSYLPISCSETEMKYSTVELKAKLESVDNEFLVKFLEIFSQVQYENENRCQRIIKEFRLARASEEAFDNLGVLQKVDKLLSEKKNK